MADFNGNITININLDAPPSVFTGFSAPLFIDATSTLDGDRVRTYETYADALADNTAGDLSAAALAAVAASFSQLRIPSQVKVGRKDSGETFAEAFAAIQAVDDNFYTVSISDRGTAASLESISAAVAASVTPKLAVLGSSDASWITATPDAGFDDLRLRESTVVIYHPTSTVAADMAWCANRLSFNPDTQSVPWDTDIQSVSAYPTALTTTQANFGLANNVNLIQPYGSVSLFIDKGVNVTGRPIYEIYTRDWFKVRLKERVANLKISLSRAGQKMVLDDTAGAVSAQRYMLSLVNALYQDGLAANHFILSDGAYFQALPVTSSDIAAQRIRIRGAARLATSARLFDFDLSFTREAIPAAS